LVRNQLTRSTTQPFILSRSINWVVGCNRMSASSLVWAASSGECLRGEGLVWLTGAVVCVVAAALHSRNHWLLPINCHFLWLYSVAGHSIENPTFTFYHPADQGWCLLSVCMGPTDSDTSRMTLTITH